MLAQMKESPSDRLLENLLVPMSDKLYWYVRMRTPRRVFRLLPHPPSYLLRSIYNFLYRAGGAPDGFPIPPSRLITLVTAESHPDIYQFLKKGYLAAQSMFNVLKRNGLNIKNFVSILDFGCGCGRVIRQLTFLNKSKLYGIDYNPELISWCRNNFDFATFATNRLNPPLDCEEGKFDFIYAFSVFTHLSEELQLSWRDEILRVLKPGGVFLITTLGKSEIDHRQNLEPRDLELFRAGNLVVLQSNLAGKNVCRAYHPMQYMRDKFSKGFKIIDFIPEGAKGNPYQDIFLLKKR